MKRFFVIALALVITAQSRLVSQTTTLQYQSAAANPDFDKGAINAFFWGDHYREEWKTPINVPVFELDKVKGGLVPLKLGGGHQTKSIRLQGKDSIQYNLRSIDKFPALVLPEALRGTWVNKILKDQISSAHPYAFLAIPKMADAIGVYHTDPEIYYLPKDADIPGYEDFLQEFGDHLFMLEIRPDEDLSNYDRFGNSENIVGTEKLFEHLYEDNDNSVDELQLAKSRLFDMVIGDWDRHWDQWRWAEFEKEGKGSRFEAVPRDRDQAFVLMDGIFPSIFKAGWAVRELSHFTYDIQNVEDFNYAGRFIDRNLLTEVTKQQWLDLAHEIQTKLTDEIITESILKLPEEIYALSGKDITAKLISRRNNLDQYAEELYLFLAENVRIVGSNKHELFKIDRLNDSTVQVDMFKTKDDGEVDKKIYSRTFFTNETKELWIYGLDGNDQFEIDGKVNESIKVRIVGGDGKDEFEDKSFVKGGSHETKVYDYPEDAKEVKKSKETKVITSVNPWVNQFERDEFKYDYLGPRFSFEINPDDGLFIGTGIYLEKQGFRRDPKFSFKLTGNFSTRTSGFNMNAETRFYSLFAHDWDVDLKVYGHNPKFAFNYFGQGNNTENVEDIDFYRIRLGQFNAEANLVKRFGRMFSVGFGPIYQEAKVEDNPNSILGEPFINDDLLNTERKQMLGAQIFANLKYMDHPVHPSKGIKWEAKAEYLNELSGDDVNFARLSTDLSIYYTPKWPFRVTFASRFGVSENVGDYLFYQSNFLGGQSNLRGFRRTRYAGKGSIYQNTEARISLAKIQNVVLNGDFGMVAFVDHGKVWADNVEESTKWTRTYGPGLYLHFYEYLVASAYYGFTPNDEHYFFLNMGFLF